jgi:hypothetical protein
MGLNNKDNKIIMVGDGTSHVIAQAVASTKRVERLLIKAFAGLADRTEETNKELIDFSKAMIRIKDNPLMKIAKSQTTNYNRRNRYRPIYRKSNVI